MKISCIVPARNEEGNISKLVENLVLALESHPETKDYEIILVDDNSTDSTPKIINTLSQENSRIRPIHRQGTHGFGNALKAGFQHATGDIIIPVMGDLSDDPSDIYALVKKIEEGYDVAYGSRFISGDRTQNYPIPKKIANRFFNNIVRFSFGLPHSDITNAFKAYRKEVLEAIGIDTLESRGFDLTVEIPIKAHILGFRSAEVPVHWYNRTTGEAKLKLRQNGSVYGKRLLSLFFRGNLIALKDLFRFFFHGSWIGILLALLFGIFLLALIFTITGFSPIISLLKQISIYWILLSCSAILLSFIMRTWRWSVLMRSAGYVFPRHILFECLMFSWFLNYLIPARLGDVARGVALKMTSDAPFGLTLSTIIIERILDVMTLLLFLGIASILLSTEWFVYIVAGSAVIVAALMGSLIIIYVFEKRIIRLLEHRIPSIRQSLSLLKGGLEKISKNPQAISLCIILSLPVWLLELASIYFAARSIGFELPFIYAGTAGVVAFIAQAFPLTPAGIGIHEASITGVLLLFSIPSAVGMSIALIDHFARGLVIYVFGLIATVHIAFASRVYFRGNNGGSK